MKRGVAYLRVSTRGQLGDDKFGLDAQRKSITEYCEKNDIEIIGWYVDEGVSGKDVNRPALDKILYGEVTNPPVDYIVVAKADRLSRKIELYYSYKQRLKEMGLEILSVQEDWSHQDQLAASILEAFMALAADIERNNIKSRMSGGRRVKADRGGYAGGQAPTGYKVVNGQLVIREDEAEMVRYLFSLKDEGYTLQAAAKALNDAGYKTRRGNPFVFSTVQSIWNNERTYRGEYRYGKDGEWVSGQHDPILK